MKKIFPATFIFFFLILPVISSAQTLTLKDFKLCLDDIGCSDSTLRLSKQALLHANRITANFSWLNIKSLTIYIGEGNYTSEINAVYNKGNIINEDTKKVFQRLSAGIPVTIEVEGYNKKGRRVPWAALSLIITE
jgi:hypothetical protein